jgi:hypothetical protein
MIKLTSLLKELLLNEYNKSQLEYIAFKLGIERNEEFNSLMNALDAQGVKYPDLKNKIISGEIKSFGDLKALKTQSKSDVVKAAKSDSEVIYDEDGIFIIIPYTHAASCYYGKGTKWCTTDKDINYWKQYILVGENTLYYVINKNLPESDILHKVAILVSSLGIEEIFNTKDKNVDEEKYFNKLKKQIGYDLRDKVNFISKNKTIEPIARKEFNKEISNHVQKYIENGSKGNLRLDFPIESLPPNLTVGKDLIIQTDTLTSLPPGLNVKGSLWIEGMSPITTLPPDIKVGKSIIIHRSNISSLPDNLKVKEDLEISFTKIKELPKNLVVKGTLYIGGTPFAEYSEEFIKQKYPGVKNVDKL